MNRPAGFLSVMQGRRSAPDELDFFPTPPWATRAFVEYVLSPALSFTGHEPQDLFGWDPCCGEGHMIETLKEDLGSGAGSDVFDYGRGYDVRDILDPGAIELNCDLLITNPPFNIAMDIAIAALTAEAARRRFGVFMLVRSNWLEAGGRYEQLFSRFPPTINAVYVERVPMKKGVYDPKASTATAYSWIGWTQSRGGLTDPITFIPPCRRRFETAEDIRRWCPPAELPLFAEAPAP